MSIRQMFPGGIVKPGFNPLAAPTPTYLYNVYSWGYGNYGQLGLGNTTSYSSPKQIGSNNWTNIAGGNNHVLSVKTDGTLWSWGRNNFGQLGTSNTNYYSSPKQVGALTTWSSVFSNFVSSFAIKTDGTLWAWGRGSFGNLGLGNTNYFSSPVQVGALTNWSKVSVGNNSFTLAIKTDGTLWSWGQNGYGQLGLGNTTEYSSPKQVGALTTWATIGRAGGSYSAAIKTDGTLWAWGVNQWGQLGLGNTTSYSSPKQVGALTNWLNVSCGYQFLIAVKTNGTLWSWGRNQNGQLGLNVPNNYSSPMQVGSLTTWLSVSASSYGNNFANATTSSYTLWSWGQNTYGQLGDGTTTTRSSPVLVSGTQRWVQTICNSDSTLGLG